MKPMTVSHLNVYELVDRPIAKVTPFDCRFHNRGLSNSPFSASKLLIARALPYWKYKNVNLKAYHREGVVFIHIPKNAGSSVSMALYGHGLDHNSIRFLTTIDRSIVQLFKFSIIRDPVDRFISAFNYLRNDAVGREDRLFGDRFLKPFVNVDDFARGFLLDKKLQREVIVWSHFRPQWEFISDSNGNIAVDALGHVADLSSLNVFLNQRLNRTLNFSNENSSTGSRYIGEPSKGIRDFYGIDNILYNLVSSSGLVVIDREQ